MVKYLVNQNAGAGNNWAKAHYTKAVHEFRNTAARLPRHCKDEAGQKYSSQEHICRIAARYLRRTMSGAAGNGLGTTIK
jgi:hypothetical protein